MTSPDHNSPESFHTETAEIPNSIQATEAGTPEPASATAPDHSGEGTGWRSMSAVQSAERVARTAADNVRATCSRAWAMVEQLIVAAIEWLRGGKSAGRHRAGMHPRMRAVQIGSLAVAAGMLGLVVSNFGDDSPQGRGVEDAAQIASLPLAPQTPAPQAPPAPMATLEAPKPEAQPETKAPEPAPETKAKPKPPGVPAKGIDVSNHNGSINWDQVAASGQHFAFILATDGDSFSSKSYEQQYTAAKKAGLYAGAYHFGRPSSSASGQAERFLQTADYKADGKTLPPVLDLEPDPNSGGCYGKSQSAMNDWIQTFVNKVKQSTGKSPIIYASTGFWGQCTGNTTQFKDTPLWLASYGVDNPKVPSGWKNYTFWQYSDKGSVRGVSGNVDVDKFNGDTNDLADLAAP